MKLKGAGLSLNSVKIHPLVVAAVLTSAFTLYSSWMDLNVCLDQELVL